MSILLWMVPLSILLAGVGLWGLLWAIRDNQYNDLQGAAERILFDDDDKK
ncbi:MAG: cbb3-type cytochrome oxidase assembly protein CcoS [Proteobacteria bacterium]|nr:cbb3-type cytochrome oxidase assembly protein CcoS [Pseudomonadota bacterium]